MVNLSQNKNVKLNNVCLYLLVIATTVGPVIYLGVAALYHFVIAGLLLMVLYKGTNTGNYKTSIMTFLLLWLFEAAISFLWAPDKMIVLKYVYYIFQINTTCILFHYFLSRENIETFSQFMVLVLLACNLIAFWEVKTGNHLLTNYLSTPLRMRVLKYVPCAFFLNPNGLATFIVQLIPFSFWSMSSSKKWVRIISSVNVVVSFFSICAAQSRTQIILCLVMCAVFVLLFYKKYLLKYGLFVFAIAILLYFIIPDFNNLIDSALKSVTGESIASSLNDEGGSLNTRVNLLKNAGYILFDTVGFGIGAGCHRAVMADYSVMYYDTHNIIVMHNLLGELFVDYGIIIGVAFMYTVVKSCSSLFKISKLHDDKKIRMMAIMLAFSLFVMIIYGMSSSSLIQTISMWFTFCFTSAFINLYQTK